MSLLHFLRSSIEMGIFRFGAGFLSKYRTEGPDGRIKDPLRIPTGQGAFTSLAIDLNADIHYCAGRIFGYGLKGTTERRQAEETARQDPAKAEIAVFNLIWEHIEELNSVFKPSREIYIAVDGAAPMSKANQQRQRRAKASVRQAEKEETLFDSNSISPGTEFMRRLDAFIKKRIAERQTKMGVTNIYYSNHLVPGEGEHKIMDAFRDDKITTLDGRHAIIGVDNDLIPLAMGLNVENIYFLSGWDRDTGRLMKFMTSIDRVQSAIFVEIGLRTSIEDRTPTVVLPANRITSDFVLLFALIGNDFLPTMPGFYDMPYNLEALFRTYKKWQKIPEPQRNRAYLTTEEGINIPAFYDFLHLLKAEESLLIRRFRVNANFVQYSAIEAATVVKGDDPEKLIVTLDMKKLQEGWWGYFERRGSEAPLQFPRVDVEFKRKVCRMLIEGFSWFFAYYVKGPSYINWNWFYPYYWAPPLTDLIAFIDDGGLPTDQWSRREGTLTPLLTSLLIFPPTSFNLLPQMTRNLVERAYKRPGAATAEPGPLSDLWPDTFELFTEGTWIEEGREPEQIIALLPVASPYRVIQEILAIRVPNGLSSLYAPGEEFRWGIEKSETIETKDFQKTLARQGRNVTGSRPYRGRREAAEVSTRVFNVSRGDSFTRGTSSPRGRGFERGRGSDSTRGYRGSSERGRGRGEFRGSRGDRGRFTPRG